MSYSEDLYEFASLNKTLTSIAIELNTSCNWRCKHCYINDYNNQSKLSLEVLDKLFIDLRELGVIHMLFTGGEIFLRDDIIDILKLARSYFFDVSLFTNVSLLDENLIKNLKDLYIDNVSCTLFSMKPEIHDNISQRKGSLLKTLKNLDILKKYNMPVQVKHIITKLNQFEYKEIADYCAKMGFDFLATTSIFLKRDKDCSPLNLRVNEDYLDIDVLKYTSKDLKKSAFAVGNVKGQKNITNSYIMWRIKALINSGKIKYEGTYGIQREMLISITDKGIGCLKSNPEAFEIWNNREREQDAKSWLITSSRNQGRLEEMIRIAKNLLAVLDVEIIAEKTGLTIEQVKNLKS